MILSEDLDKLQVFLDRLNDSVFTFGLFSATPKCKMLLRDWTCQNPIFIHRWLESNEIEMIHYLGSYISQAGRI